MNLPNFQVYGQVCLGLSHHQKKGIKTPRRPTDRKRLTHRSKKPLFQDSNSDIPIPFDSILEKLLRAFSPELIRIAG